MPFLLAERARSECARSMRAVKGSLGHSLIREVEKQKVPVQRARARLSGWPVFLVCLVLLNEFPVRSTKQTR